MKIYNVSSSKGGVGKSTVAIGLIHHLINAGSTVHCIETDNSNPDVGLIYRDETAVSPICLDQKEGWMQLMDAIEDVQEEAIVINGAARSTVAWRDYGNLLFDASTHLEANIVTIWVLDCKHDSMQLLDDFLAYVPNHPIVAAINTHWGTRDQFWRWDQSQLKQKVSSEILIPRLANRCADIFHSDKVSPGKALQGKTLRLADRIEISSWVRKFSEAIQGITT